MLRLHRLPMRNLRAASRAGAVARHMSSSASNSSAEIEVKFYENLSLRQFILNRPAKLNSLSLDMLKQLAPVIHKWDNAELTGVIVGSGAGKAFCAGGDVATIVKSMKGGNKTVGYEFFNYEYGLDYYLSVLSKPYVAILDGITFGGGFGLAAPAPFRVATEKTQIAMPETKIGYFPDVGASYYLSRLDGELGAYLGLTSIPVKGREAFELGLATHYVHSSRIPILLERLSALESPTFAQVNETINELSAEKDGSETHFHISGPVRSALDNAFALDDVELILQNLTVYANESGDADVATWAKETISMIEDRSPTSLRVALKAIRLGKTMSLRDVFDMELRLATAFTSRLTPDFETGVSAVIVEKSKERPMWIPNKLSDVSGADVDKFFEKRDDEPELLVPFSADNRSRKDLNRFRQYALPSEEIIKALVTGDHPTSTDTALTLDELLERVDELTNQKYGAREKAREVVDRKCVLQGGKYLQWK